jgi:hypothetical protein
MKSMLYKTLIGFFVAVTLVSCSLQDDIATELLQGTYTGTFTVTYLNGTTFSNPVTVQFNERQTYVCSANNNYIPAGGSGTYQKYSTTIKFSDQNFWTANFDWNLILNGDYSYTLTPQTLTLQATISNIGIYQYQLTKQY